MTIVGELLEIDQLHHRFQKLTDQPQSSTDNESIKINITTNLHCSDSDKNTSSNIFNNIVILVIPYLS